MLAMLACETGIPASVLATEDYQTIECMMDYLKSKSKRVSRHGR